MKPDRPNFDNIYISYNSECTRQGKEVPKNTFLSFIWQNGVGTKAFFQKFPFKV